MMFLSGARMAIQRVAFSLFAWNVLQEPALHRTSPVLVFDSLRRTARYHQRASERDINDTALRAGEGGRRGRRRGARNLNPITSQLAAAVPSFTWRYDLRERLLSLVVPDRSFKRSQPILGNKSRRELVPLAENGKVPVYLKEHVEEWWNDWDQERKKKEKTNMPWILSGDIAYDPTKSTVFIARAAFDRMRPTLDTSSSSSSSSFLPRVCMYTVCSGTRVWSCCTCGTSWPSFYLIQVPDIWTNHDDYEGALC